MKNKLIKILEFTLPILFWGAIWQVLALIIDHPFLLPGIPETFTSLVEIVTKKAFFKTVFLSILRVLAGLLLGTALGVIFAALSYYFRWIKVLFSPFVSVVKATPIATVIILFWILFSGDLLVILIAVLMVLPIVWQNVLDGFGSIDRELIEVADVYQFSFPKRMKVLILPALSKYLIPAIITSTGLAWKAVISAEIIAYVKNSIGQLINDAKTSFDTSTVFAWTFIVIVLSLILERGTKYLLRRYKL